MHIMRSPPRSYERTSCCTKSMIRKQFLPGARNLNTNDIHDGSSHPDAVRSCVHRWQQRQ